jgi:hypothetical protein
VQEQECALEGGEGLDMIVASKPGSGIEDLAAKSAVGVDGVNDGPPVTVEVVGVVAKEKGLIADRENS